VFILELHTSDVHDVLGRLLDRTRVAGLKLAAVRAWTEAGEYRIQASIDTGDRDVIDNFVDRVGTLAGVVALAVRRDCSLATPAGAYTVQN
jgi:hypothetical protein